MDVTPYKEPSSLGRTLGALAAGVVYGLFLRVGAGQKIAGLQIVSVAFLVVAPFCVGAFAVIWAAGGHRISVGRQFGVATVAMLLFLLAMFVCLLEGLICIVLVAPVFLVAAIIGALAAGFLHNRFKAGRATMPVFVLLPFLLGPLEAGMPPPGAPLTVVSHLHVDASAEQVFDQLGTVEAIREEELGFAFMHTIGLPRPLSSSMNGQGVGSVRKSSWQKGVSFNEVITLWDRPRAMHYRFDIPPGSIPRYALDEHVEMGGKYFTVLDGGFDIVPAPGGGVDLTLSTRFQNKSHLKVYGDLWGRMVLADFHQSILGLMKSRAEHHAPALHVAAAH